MLAKRIERPSDDTKMDLTPMIDVTFLILVFFMCTLKFKVLEGKLSAHLPDDVGVGKAWVPIEKIDIRISVAEPGNAVRRAPGRNEPVPYTAEDAARGLRFSFDETRALRFDVAGQRFDDLASAVDRVARIRRLEPDAKVSIDARDGVIQQDVVSALDALEALGVRDVTFKAWLDRE